MYPENYSEMGQEERLNHWSKVLYNGMRWAGEDGKEEISIFDQKLIRDLRTFDSSIDAILPTVITQLAVMWLEEPEEFVSKVNEQCNTAYTVDISYLNGRFHKIPSPKKKSKWWHVFGRKT